MNVKWINIIKHLFDVSISTQKQDVIKYDDYMYSTFECFVKQKRRADFRLSNLSYCKEDVRNLIIVKIIETDARQEVTRIRTMVNDAII